MHWDLELETEIKKLSMESPLKPIIKPIVLDYKDKDYTKKLYTNMIEIIDDGDEVILDITHGFRSYAILISSILDYVKVFKDVNVKNIVYGEYDRESKVTEIKELDELLTIQTWSNYVDIFLKTGNPTYLGELVSEDKKQSNIQKDGYQNIYHQMSGLAGNLNRLFEAVGICDTKKIISLVRDLYNNLATYKTFKEEFDYYPLVSLIEKISHRIEQLYDESDSILILNVTEFYCLEFGQIQQAYTLLRELMISDVGQKLGLDINDRKVREGYINVILFEMGDRKKEDDGSNKKYKPKYKAELVQLNQEYGGNGLEIGKIFDRIIQTRNNINHAGFSQETKLNYSRYIEDLKSNINSLRGIYKTAQDSE